MLNYIWASMIIIGIIYGSVSGNIEDISNCIINAGGEAVSLAITMMGVVAMWTGIMNIAKSCGIIERMQMRMEFVIGYLFPKIPKGHVARDYIAINFIANIFGLGWAATPAGLSAMRELSKLSNKKMSNEMCTFLIINISSLQLIPINIIAYRSQFGSANPAAVVGPAIAATCVSTMVGIGFCKIMQKRYD